jgi:hypothetical protein
MQNTRLIKTLSLLNPGEMRRFVQWVESPFINGNEKLQKLARWFQEAHPHFPERLIGRDRLFEVMFGPDVPYREQAVYDHASLLLRLAEQFLAFLGYEQDGRAGERYLLSELGARDKGPLFEKAWGDAQEKMAEEPYRDTRYYLNSFLLEQSGDAFAGKNQNRAFHETLIRATQGLDVFYLASRLKSCCELFNRKHIVRTSFQPDLPEDLLAFIRQPDYAFLEVPSIAIYYEVLMLLTTSEHEQHYRSLLGLLDIHAARFSRSEAYQMYAYAQNYCIRRINTGDSAYLEELFKLYCRLLDTGILMENGVLAHEHYKNVTTVGLRLGAYDWVARFLETYREKLPPEYRQNAYSYNLSVYYYEQGQYREAMKLLQQVEFNDIYYHLSGKSVLLKIYYEIDDQESLQYLKEAFRALLKRNRQVSGNHAETYNRFVSYLIKINKLRKQKAHLSAQEFAARAEDLRQNLSATRGLPNGEWLKKKIEELTESSFAK